MSITARRNSASIWTSTSGFAFARCRRGPRIWESRDPRPEKARVRPRRTCLFPQPKNQPELLQFRHHSGNGPLLLQAVRSPLVFSLHELRDFGLRLPALDHLADLIAHLHDVVAVGLQAGFI